MGERHGHAGDGRATRIGDASFQSGVGARLGERGIDREREQQQRTREAFHLASFWRGTIAGANGFAW
jgi:hypothetical protein